MFNFFKRPHEQRQFSRLKTHCLVRYSRVAGDSLTAPALTNVKNISQGGILITAFEPLVPGEKVKVEVKLPSREEPIIAFARVVQCRKIKNGPNFYAGIHFLDISKEDREEIFSHVQLLSE